MRPFKDVYREESVCHMASILKKHGAPTLLHSDLIDLTLKLKKLEMRERSKLIAEALKKHLSKDIDLAYDLFLKSLAPIPTHKPLLESPRDIFWLNPEGLSGFMLWPVSDFIAEAGLNFPEKSFKLIKAITSRFTGEFCIRPFIVVHPTKTWSVLKDWALDENEHVRRLASEGSRPLLPWGLKLQASVNDPTPNLELLENLKYDQSLYVRKSVANHLNDISKHHPKLVIENLKKWEKSAPQDYLKEMKWCKQHACRTLIKKGNKEALKLLGVKKTSYKLSDLKLKKSKIKLGESLDISFLILNQDKKRETFVFDIEIDFLKANGKHSPKVFKGKKIPLLPAKKTPIKISIPLKKVTTRKYYAGKHFFALKINGDASNKLSFNLEVS